MKMRWMMMALMLTILGVGCTYDEGPDFSLATKKSRLVNTWNQTIGSGGQAYPSGMTVVLEITKDGTGKETTTLINPVTGNKSEAILDVKWEWGATKEELKLERIWAGVSQGTKIYRIVRLAGDEMFLENDSKIIEKFESVK